MLGGFLIVVIIIVIAMEYSWRSFHRVAPMSRLTGCSNFIAINMENYGSKSQWLLMLSVVCNNKVN